MDSVNSQNQKQTLKLSILIPTYNAENLIEETLKSLLSQNFPFHELIINDDNSSDQTYKKVKQFKDKRIKFFRNSKNLGYPANLESGRKKCSGDILFIMAQDDILASRAIQETYDVFDKNPKVGAVTRPYFWFYNDINKPVRAKKPLNLKNNEIVTIFDEPQRVIRVIDTLDQFSALAYRTKFMDIGFHPDIFPCHIYPFISIFKHHPVIFLKNYNLAVRITSSQSRHVSSIYEQSPMLTWIYMINNLLGETKYKSVAKYLISDFIAINYVGLVQLKNFAKYKYLLREIYYLVKFRPKNLINLQFWFFSLGTMIIPAQILIPMVDYYKNYFNSQNLPKINFSYKL